MRRHLWMVLAVVVALLLGARPLWADLIAPGSEITQRTIERVSRPTLECRSCEVLRMAPTAGTAQLQPQGPGPRGCNGDVLY